MKCSKTEEEIKEMLGEQLIVPVLRDESNCCAPKVGDPCLFNLDISNLSSQDSSIITHSSNGITSPLKVK